MSHPHALKKPGTLEAVRAAEALPLPRSAKLWSEFARDEVVTLLAPNRPPAFEKVLPIGRELKAAAPTGLGDLVRTLAAALVPPADEHPMPFIRIAR